MHTHHYNVLDYQWALGISLMSMHACYLPICSALYFLLIPKVGLNPHARMCPRPLALQQLVGRGV